MAETRSPILPIGATVVVVVIPLGIVVAGLLPLLACAVVVVGGWGVSLVALGRVDVVRGFRVGGVVGVGAFFVVAGDVGAGTGVGGGVGRLGGMGLPIDGEAEVVL